MNKTAQIPKIDKVFATLGIIFIAFSIIIIAATSPATGLEISIYDAYPMYFWFFLIAAMTCGIIILVHQSFDEKASGWWKSGYLILLSANLIILLLPLFRLYAVSRRYDILSHIGFIKDILHTGHFGAGNLYPIMHILTINSNYITGLNIELLVMFLPTFFFIFYIVSLHLFSRVSVHSHGQALLMTAFGSLLLFRDQNSMFFPTLQCFQLVPFILFLLYKAKINNSKSAIYTFLLIIMLFLVPFTHPGEGTLFLLIILFCFAIIPLLFEREKMQASPFGNLFNFKNMVGVIGILLIVWITWFSSFAMYAKSVEIIYNWLVLNVGTTNLDIYNKHYSGMLSKAELSFYQFIELFIKMYGQYAIYYLIALVISINYWWKFLIEPKKANKTGILFSGFFFVIGAAAVVFILFYPYTSITRNLNWLFFAATVLNGYGLYEIFNGQDRKKIGALTVCFILLATATIGLFNTFPSPIIRDNYYHATRMDLIGTEWFLGHQNDDFQIIWINHALMRFSHASMGYNAIPKNVLEINMFSPPRSFWL